MKFLKIICQTKVVIMISRKRITEKFPDREKGAKIFAPIISLLENKRFYLAPKSKYRDFLLAKKDIKFFN